MKEKIIAKVKVERNRPWLGLFLLVIGICMIIYFFCSGLQDTSEPIIIPLLLLWIFSAVGCFGSGVLLLQTEPYWMIIKETEENTKKQVIEYKKIN